MLTLFSVRVLESFLGGLRRGGIIVVFTKLNLLVWNYYRYVTVFTCMAHFMLFEKSIPLNKADCAGF